MTAIDDIRAQLDTASSVIERFRHSVGHGMTVDLSGLDENIAAMCESIATLPPDQRAVLKGRLVALMDDMDGLVASLQQQQDATSQDLKGVSSRQQAVAAYGKRSDPGK